MARVIIERQFVRRNVILILMGVLVFSPICSLITIKLFHLPVSMPEIMILPFVFLFKKEIKRFNRIGNSFSGFFILTILLIVIGLLWGEYSIFSIISTARAWLYLFLFYCFFKDTSCRITYVDLMYVSAGCIIGWLTSSLLAFRVNVVSTNDDTQLTYGVLLSIPFFLASSFINRRNILLIIGSVAIVATIIFSGVRRLLLIFLLSVFFVFLYSFQKNRKKMFQFVFIFGLLTAGLIKVLPFIESKMQESSWVLHYRIFGRTEKYIRGEGDDSDMGRATDIVQLLETSYEYFIPRGFVSHQTSTDKGAGDFTDLPLKELLWTYSIFGTLFILIHFLRRYKYHIKRSSNLGDDNSYVCAVVLSLFFSLLFIEGTFLSFVYSTPFSGACLGLIDRKMKNKSLR